MRRHCAALCPHFHQSATVVQILTRQEELRRTTEWGLAEEIVAVRCRNQKVTVRYFRCVIFVTFRCGCDEERHYCLLTLATLETGVYLYFLGKNLTETLLHVRH